MDKSYFVKPAKRITGEIEVPGDKSISHRAVLIGAIAQGMTEIAGFGPGDDLQCTVECVRALGVEVEQKDGKLLVHGRWLRGLKPPQGVLWAGNSGTTMRLLSGVLAGQNFEVTIDGDQSLRTRPMDRVIEPLSRMGAQVQGREGKFAPLVIRGSGLRAIHYRMPVASAQVKSCVLLAGLYAPGKTTVTEPAPSRDHTERMLRQFGARIEVDGLRVAVQGEARLEGQRVEIPGDISSAAFFLVAASLLPGSELRVKNVGLNPRRDGGLRLLRAMGADISVVNLGEWGGEPVGDVVVRGTGLKGMEVSGEIIPQVIDELPVLAMAGPFVSGELVIRDAEELRKKETDRIRAVVANLRQMGAQVKELPDGMVVRGGTGLRGARVRSYGDHRMAMALVIAGLLAWGETVVEGVEWIDISFPGFMETLAQVCE